MNEKTEFVELNLLLPDALASKINSNINNEQFNFTFYFQLCLKRYGMDFIEIIKSIYQHRDLETKEIIRAIRREFNIKKAPKKGGPINRVEFHTEFIINSETLKDKVERFESANKQLQKRSKQRLRKNLKDANELESIFQFIKERDDKEYEEKKEFFHTLYLMDELMKKSI